MNTKPNFKNWIITLGITGFLAVLLGWVITLANKGAVLLASVSWNG